MSAGYFVPDGFVPPRPLAAERFVLEPLRPEHNAADLAAWTSSIDHVRSTPGFPNRGWPPADGMSSDRNLDDLRRHAEDFVAKRGFTYTVKDPVDGDVIGCVYLYPTEGPYDVVVRSWVRASHADLDVPLAEWLATEWPWINPDRCGREERHG